MEMKTLKDLEYQDDFCYVSSSEDLRQEAIKWIKYIGVCKNNNIQIVNLEDAAKQVGILMCEKETNLVRDWIKHFFNITEEDLK